MTATNSSNLSPDAARLAAEHEAAYLRMLRDFLYRTTYAGLSGLDDRPYFLADDLADRVYLTARCVRRVVGPEPSAPMVERLLRELNHFTGKLHYDVLHFVTERHLERASDLEDEIDDLTGRPPTQLSLDIAASMARHPAGRAR